MEVEQAARALTADLVHLIEALAPLQQAAADEAKAEAWGHEAELGTAGAASHLGEESPAGTPPTPSKTCN